MARADLVCRRAHWTGYVAAETNKPLRLILGLTADWMAVLSNAPIHT
jgi:hypothetical protein